MATPTTAITRHDLSMTFGEFNTDMNRRGFIGLDVLPPIDVGLQNANFSKIPKEAMGIRSESLKRAPKAAYKRDDFEWETDSYRTDEHGAEEVVDDRNVALYRNEIRAEAISRQRATDRVAMEYEIGAAAAVFNTGTWTGATLTTAIGTVWTTAASADPVADIDGAKKKVITSCGHSPNALVLSQDAFRLLIRTDRIEDLIKYSGRDDPKSLLTARQAVSDLVQLPHVIVSNDTVYNSTDEGQDATFTRIWNTTYCMVCRIAEPGDDDLESLVPSIGRTIVWTGDGAAMPGADDDSIGLTVEEYREENVRGGIIRARTEYQQKIIYAQAGHLLTGLQA